MMVKLLMTWDIRPGKETKYFEFLTQEFAPTLMKLGVTPTDAWYAVARVQGPEVRTGGVTEDLETMEEILSSAEWKTLHEKLSGYVTNLTYKIVEVEDPREFKL